MNYYKKLIELRKNNDVIVYGNFKMLNKDNKSLFAYTRNYKGETLLVISNFTDKKVEQDFNLTGYQKLIGNYKNDINNVIRPYETKVYLK